MTEELQNPAVSPESGKPEESKPVRNRFADIGKKKSRFSKKQKRIFFAALAVLFVVLAVLSVRHLLKKGTNEGQTQTGIASRGRLESFITGWGTVVPKEQETLGSDIRGEIIQVFVKAGDSVKIGDPLFSVDDDLMRDDLDDAMVEYDQAEESYRTISEEISNLSLRAPFDGKLVKLEASNIKAGQDISSGTAVGTFADDSVMKLSLYYSYGFADGIKAGMNATVSVPASMASVAGRVDSVEMVKKISDEGAILFKVNVSLKNPGTLTKDMVATAAIHSGSGDILPAESGKLQYNQEESIAFQASGEVVSTDIHEYKEYKKGQVMCQLKSDKDPERQLADAQSKLDDATKKVEDCKKALSQSTVTSPIAGVVTSILKEAGDEIENYGTDIMVISNLSKMVVEINIEEMDISKVSVGLPVEISYDKTDGTTTLMGEISTMSFEAKSDSNQSGGVAYFPAKIILDNPGDLMPGIGVNYRISALVKEDCLMVPSAAITYTEEGTAVFVKTADGRAVEKPATVPAEQIPEGYVAALVEIGLSDDQNTEIVSGLIEGDEVALIGQANQDMGMMGASVMVG